MARHLLLHLLLALAPQPPALHRHARHVTHKKNGLCDAVPSQPTCSGQNRTAMVVRHSSNVH